MSKYMKREMRFLGENAATIVLFAFLCALGGVLLWINGGSSWYMIRTSGGSAPALSVIFFVWVITYSLIGAASSMIWLVYRDGKREFCRSIPWFCLSMLSYLFMLVWYAVFFCTRLVIFAAVILILSCIADVLLFLFMRRTLLCFSITIAVVFAVQVYFVWFTFAAA